MVKISSLSIIGFIIMITPVIIGLPRQWADVVYFVLGAVVIILSFLIRRELHDVMKVLHGGDITADTHKENLKK